MQNTHPSTSQSKNESHTTDGPPVSGKDHFLGVTELSGQQVSEEQLSRTCHRYYWARQFVEGKDAVEVACGAGQGLGYLARHAKSLKGGDISPEILAQTRAVWGERFPLSVFDAARMPFEEGSFDVVLLFEAIYYLPDAGRFMQECLRVLRPGGIVLIATANKDLFDFTRSAYSTSYYGVVELAALCSDNGFAPEFWGYFDASRSSLRQRILRPVKMLASQLNLIPKTMDGKAWLKRLYFGKMVEMPASIETTPRPYNVPEKLSSLDRDRRHKVIYCAARKL